MKDIVFVGLPQELIEHVLSFLDYYQVLKVRRLCRKFCRYLETLDVDTDIVWMQLLRINTVSRFRFPSPREPGRLDLVPRGGKENASAIIRLYLGYACNVTSVYDGPCIRSYPMGFTISSQNDGSWTCSNYGKLFAYNREFRPCTCECRKDSCRQNFVDRMDLHKTCQCEAYHCRFCARRPRVFRKNWCGLCCQNFCRKWSANRCTMRRCRTCCKDTSCERHSRTIVPRGHPKQTWLGKLCPPGTPVKTITVIATASAIVSWSYCDVLRRGMSIK